MSTRSRYDFKRAKESRNPLAREKFLASIDLSKSRIASLTYVKIVHLLNPYTYMNVNTDHLFALREKAKLNVNVFPHAFTLNSFEELLTLLEHEEQHIIDAHREPDVFSKNFDEYFFGKYLRNDKNKKEFLTLLETKDATLFDSVLDRVKRLIKFYNKLFTNDALDDKLLSRNLERVAYEFDACFAQLTENVQGTEKKLARLEELLTARFNLKFASSELSALTHEVGKLPSKDVSNDFIHMTYEALGAWIKQWE